MDETDLATYTKEVYDARTTCLVLADELESITERLFGVTDLEVTELLSGITSILKELALNLKGIATRISDNIE